jgi:hypothetical protein
VARSLDAAPQEFSCGKFKRLRGLRYATTLRYDGRGNCAKLKFDAGNVGIYSGFVEKQLFNCGLQIVDYGMREKLWQGENTDTIISKGQMP